MFDIGYNSLVIAKNEIKNFEKLGENAMNTKIEKMNLDEIPSWITDFAKSRVKTAIAKTAFKEEQDCGLESFAHYRQETINKLKMNKIIFDEITLDELKFVDERILPASEWSGGFNVLVLSACAYQTASVISNIASKMRAGVIPTPENVFETIQKKKILEANILDYLGHVWADETDPFYRDFNTIKWDSRGFGRGGEKAYLGNFFAEWEKRKNAQNEIELQVELSRASINNVRIWKEKINYFGNSNSCWRPGGAWSDSSKWFSWMEARYDAFGIYFYASTQKLTYMLNGLGAIGRIWALYDFSSSVVLGINPYSVYDSISENHLLRSDNLLTIAGLNRSDTIYGSLEGIYINGNRFYYPYGYRIRPEFICETIRRYYDLYPQNDNL